MRTRNLVDVAYSAYKVSPSKCFIILSRGGARDDLVVLDSLCTGARTAGGLSLRLPWAKNRFSQTGYVSGLVIDTGQCLI